MIGSLFRAGRDRGRRLQLCPQRTFFAQVMDFLGPKVDLEPMKVFQGTPDDTLIKSVGAHCDAEYGGGSESAHEFVEEEGQPFLRWKGKMNFKEEHIVKTKATGGFCALKIDFKKPIDLLDFQGLEISLRTRKDLRIFVNLRFSTYIENDMYQMCLELKGERDWKTLFTPFGMYQLTSNGNMKEQMMQNDHLQLESVGLLVTDSQAGEFSVDIRHIQAMNAGM